MIWVFIIMFSYGLFEWAWVVQKRWMYLYQISHIKYHIYILLYTYIYIQISNHYFGHWCYCSIFLLVGIRPSPDPPLDEATRSGRSPRDFRPLQSNPWCRHCLCNAYLRLFQGQWWNFWKCHVWLVYPCISHVWLVYIPSIAGRFHMSTYGYPARNWQKSIAPEAIVQLWKSSRNHMGRQ